MKTFEKQDSPSEAISCLERDSSWSVSAWGTAVGCLTSFSSSSGVTSFIRLWLHTLATSLIPAPHQCKECIPVTIPYLRRTVQGRTIKKTYPRISVYLKPEAESFEELRYVALKTAKANQEENFPSLCEFFFTIPSNLPSSIKVLRFM